MRINPLVLVIFWALGCVYVYLLTEDVVDQLKEKHPDRSPLLYDIIDVAVCMCWPLLIPGTFMKTIKRIKEKRKK